MIIKCPWCGRVMMITKGGHLATHGMPPCIGTGQPASQVEARNKLKDSLPSPGRDLAKKFKKG